MSGAKTILNDDLLCKEYKREIKVSSTINPVRVESSFENVLIKDVNDTFQKCFDTLQLKNKDYGGSDKTPYSNFMNSTIVGVSVEKGIMVRMMDKVSRINTLLEKENVVKDESINDTLEDLINYVAILKSYLKNK